MAAMAAMAAFSNGLVLSMKCFSAAWSLLVGEVRAAMQLHLSMQQLPHNQASWVNTVWLAPTMCQQKTLVLRFSSATFR